MKNIPITLELHIPAEERASDVISADDDFYRYSVGEKFQIWFSQSRANGNIYTASMATKHSDVPNNIEFYISSEHMDDFYPTRFRLRAPSQSMSTSEVDAFVQEVQEAQAYLHAVQEFFRTSEHAVKYWKHRAMEMTQHVYPGDYGLTDFQLDDGDLQYIAQQVIDGDSLENAMHHVLQQYSNMRDEMEEEL